MNIIDFEHPEFGIKGVTQDDINLLKTLCDELGQIPFFRSNIKNYKYNRNFSEEEWQQHTKNCDTVVNSILDRVKFLPDKIDHFDWWTADK